MKLHALDQPVFGDLGDFEITAAQGVVEGYGRGLSADDGDGLSRLRFILVIGKLRHCIGAGEQIEIDGAVLAGSDSLIDAVAGDIELDALDLAVLTGLYDSRCLRSSGIGRTGGASATPHEPDL